MHKISNSNIEIRCTAQKRFPKLCIMHSLLPYRIVHKSGRLSYHERHKISCQPVNGRPQSSYLYDKMEIRASYVLRFYFTSLLCVLCHKQKTPG